MKLLVYVRPAPRPAVSQRAMRQHGQYRLDQQGRSGLTCRQKLGGMETAPASSLGLVARIGTVSLGEILVLVAGDIDGSLGAIGNTIADSSQAK